MTSRSGVGGPESLVPDMAPTIAPTPTATAIPAPTSSSPRRRRSPPRASSRLRALKQHETSVTSPPPAPASPASPETIALPHSIASTPCNYSLHRDRDSDITVDAAAGDEEGYEGLSTGDEEGCEALSAGDEEVSEGLSTGDEEGYEGLPAGDEEVHEGPSVGDEEGYEGLSAGYKEVYEGPSTGDKKGYEGLSTGNEEGYEGPSTGDVCGYQQAQGSQFEEAMESPEHSQTWSLRSRSRDPQEEVIRAARIKRAGEEQKPWNEEGDGVDPCDLEGRGFIDWEAGEGLKVDGLETGDE